MTQAPQPDPTRARQSPFAVISTGAAIGTLGGLIGLGGAEFRLPLLIGLFRFGALDAVILNKAASLAVVATALPFRLQAVPADTVLAHWTVAANLLAGSLAGAWFAAGWATRLRADLLYKVIAALLVVMAVVLLFGHGASGGNPALTGPGQIIAGVAAGVAIGAVAAVMGVAGGELLIPTLVILYGLDIKLAGSMSLAISLPTMLTGFARYSRDSSFAVIGRNASFLLFMVAGSVLGSWIGSQLLGIAPVAILIPGLAALLLISAVKVWSHR